MGLRKQIRWKRATQPRSIVDPLCNFGEITSFSHYFFSIANTTVIMQPKQQAKKETCKPCGTTQGEKPKANMGKPDTKVDPK